MSEFPEQRQCPRGSHLGGEGVLDTGIEEGRGGAPGRAFLTHLEESRNLTSWPKKKTPPSIVHSSKESHATQWESEGAMTRKWLLTPETDPPRPPNTQWWVPWPSRKALVPASREAEEGVLEARHVGQCPVCCLLAHQLAAGAGGREAICRGFKASGSLTRSIYGTFSKAENPQKFAEFSRQNCLRSGRGKKVPPFHLGTEGFPLFFLND